MPFCPLFVDGRDTGLSTGKIVCVGRNYSDHTKERGGEIPDQPVVFIKPATAAVAFDAPIETQFRRGELHFETELALLIGERLCDVDGQRALEGVIGAGLALDLTLRDVQSDLIEQNYPWERAKGFNGACPVSRFVPVKGGEVDWQALAFHLDIDGERQQTAHTKDMLFSVATMLENVSHTFTLEPGDILLTGTPAGAGRLPRPARLDASLSLGLEATAHAK